MWFFIVGWSMVIYWHLRSGLNFPWILDITYRVCILSHWIGHLLLRESERRIGINCRYLYSESKMWLRSFYLCRLRDESWWTALFKLTANKQHWEWITSQLSTYGTASHIQNNASTLTATTPVQTPQSPGDMYPGLKAVILPDNRDNATYPVGLFFVEKIKRLK